MNWLKGKKTYIGSIAGALIIIAWSLNLIEETVAKKLLGIVAAWTAVSFRLAIKGVK